MIVESRRDLPVKMILAHGFLLAFRALTLSPVGVILSISFHEGNFAAGHIIPENRSPARCFGPSARGHWRRKAGSTSTRSATSHRFAGAAILSGLPVTVVFFVAQRYLVSGPSEGSRKGRGPVRRQRSPRR